ncbi:AbrB/MazE/SpoVT family DNA-binding domain-containing protein [Micromonospora sp. NPDC047548]|uniref:AbrB/MazE/SpoVT family DNA-binding domain-containing protein n=1 Tax=Micromonospora sp. NPDC047548 TaxID=3155624 RepID=UPI003409DADD
MEIWYPSSFHEDAGLVVVRVSAQGIFTLTGQRHLHLPAAVRKWCGLKSGERVLLAADPTAGILVVHPPAALDQMIVQAHTVALAVTRDE